MLKKGWNEDYLLGKMKEYERLSQISSGTLKEEYEDELFTYQILYATLIFQEGTVKHNGVSTSEFLESYNDLDFSYFTPSDLTIIYQNIMEQILQLSPLEHQNFNGNIKQEEAFSLVGEFIKSKFGMVFYRIYQKYILENRDYILFDKLGNTASTTTTLGGEFFIKLPSYENIDLVAKIAHETGHVTRRVKNSILLDGGILGEYESFSYEIGILLWMMENNIHREEARKNLINLMLLLESLTITRYFTETYKLHKYRDVDALERTIIEHSILERVNASNNNDLFNLIATSLDINFPEYLMSFFLALDTLETPDFTKRYQSVITNLGRENDISILKRVKNDNFGNLQKYNNLRNNLIR